MTEHDKAVEVRKQWEGTVEQLWKEWLGTLFQRQDSLEGSKSGKA